MIKILAFYIIGLIGIVIGLIWIGQGSGYFRYPAESFMIDQSIWEVWGAVTVVVGIVLMLIGRHLAR